MNADVSYFAQHLHNVYTLHEWLRITDMTLEPKINVKYTFMAHSLNPSFILN